MTLELALSLALVAVVLAAHAADWHARRTPLGRINADLREARERRRR